MSLSLGYAVQSLPLSVPSEKRKGCRKINELLRMLCSLLISYLHHLISDLNSDSGTTCTTPHGGVSVMDGVTEDHHSNLFAVCVYLSVVYK